MFVRKGRKVARSEKRKNRKKKSTANTKLMLGYHQPVLEELHASRRSIFIRALLDEPRRYSEQYWSLVLNGQYAGDAAWELLRTYLDTLENRIAEIARSHSLYFWQHLYRRIGVHLYSGHSNKRDSTTLALVRDIVELAFVKYAQLIGPDDARAEIQLAENVRDDEILGGLLVDVVRRRPILQALLRRLRRQPGWVITRFDPSDLDNIYRLEGLAYEYWLTTARMRSVGKGVVMHVRDGRLGCVHTAEQDRLVASYDARSAREPFASSNIGVGFFRSGQDKRGITLFASYNVEKKSLCEVAGILPSAKDMRDFVTNFKYGGADLAAFYHSHSFLESDFRASKNYALVSLVAFIAAISMHSFSYTISSSRSESVRAITQLFERAIDTFESTPYLEAVTLVAKKWAKEILAVDGAQVVADAKAVMADLTITDQSRARRGLWSHGPRFAFLPWGEATIVDLAALKIILENAFVGVRHDQTARGTAFEDRFRDLVFDRGLRLLPDRDLKTSSGARETDAAVGVGDTLYLCDCRSMERPLDHEIGRPSTMAKRREWIEQKITKVLSLVDFVQQSPSGRNYDFSWAKRIVGLAVSPFVEYVWAEGERFWIDRQTPRLLSAQEAVEVMGRGTLS